MKKFRKSKINRRIISSLKRISLVFFGLFLILSMGGISGTNSYFTDTAVSTGNTVTAGYWIPPAVSATSPDSGDEWQVGSQHNIIWTANSADPSATVSMLIDIDYKCGAGSYSSIVAGTANDGTYTWTIPPTISNDCRIKITAADSHGLSNSAESDQFEISRMVVLNEFLPNPTGSDDANMPNGEWVELYNNGSVAIDAGGWYLYDSDNAHELQISTSNSDNDGDSGDSGETIVPAHGWLVVYRNGDGDFELNNSPGDTVRLYDGAIGSGANLLDSHTYSTTNIVDTDPNDTKGSGNTLDGNKLENGEGKTFARVPDGTGGWVDPVPTPGEKNTESNDLEDFQKYYEEFCFDKKDRPTCDKEFMESLDLLKKNTDSTDSPQAAPEAAAPITDPVPVDEGSKNPAPADSTSSPQADPVAAPPVDPEAAPETKPEAVPDIIEKTPVAEEKPAVEEKSAVEEKPAEVVVKKEEEKPVKKADKADGSDSDKKEETKKDEAAKPDDNSGDKEKSDSSASTAN